MGKKAPKSPDPAETAAAQGAMNRDTAITQQELNMVNQSGPWGSVNYQQTGTSASGTPTYTQTTSLSPSQQAIFDQSQAAQGNLAKIAANQSGFLQNYLGEGIDLSGVPSLQSGFGSNFNPQFNGNVGLNSNLGLAESYAGAGDFSADRQRVEDALWQRTAGDRSAQDADLRTSLANKGIKEGSEAWNSEMERMGRQNTDARLATVAAGGQEQQRMVEMARQAAMFGNDSRLAQGQFGNNAAMSQWQAGMAAQQAQNSAAAQQTGQNNSARQQGIAEAYAQRNQPINEISALLSGAQVSNPAQMGAASPQTGVDGVNYAGMVQQDYQNRMGAYQNKMNSMGGLFSLGGSALGMW